MAPPIKTKTKPRFNYQQRSVEDMEQRQRSFSGRDSYFSNDVKFFVPKPGANKIRVLPPTWDDAKHYGLDIYVHYGIGPDNVGYLCLDRMSGEKCPLCEARVEADQDGEEELAKSLRATRRVAVYVIDRAAESEGPKIWASPQTVDKEICAQAFDKETGEVYALDNPDEGYDVSFTVEGQGPTKKYVGVRLARRSSPITDDDKTADAWLTFINDHTIPEMLVIRSYDDMKQAFEGKSSRGKDKDKEEESTKPSSKIKAKVKEKEPEEEAEDEEEEEKPKKGETKSRPKIGAQKEVEKDDDEPTWEEVHEMDQETIGDLAEKHDIDFGTKEFDSLEECQNFVCKKLKIARPVEEEEEEVEEEKPKSKLSDRLRNMGKKK